MTTTKKLTYTLLISLVALVFAYSPIAQAQNWMALPPYNTLWPLWSPALSPVDAISGLPTPIVNSLTPSTILPVQPGLTWDPSAANPWLLYNTPLGMVHYDPIGGINLWPPSYLLDTAGSPLPLSLPLGYELLPPTDPTWINTNVPLGNAAALAYLMLIPAPLFGVTPTTFVPPVLPTTWVAPVLPTTWVAPTLPTTWVAPTLPTTWVAPTLPTTWVPPVLPTTWVPPVLPTTFIGPTLSPLFPTFLTPSAII